jgi:hypothetical protein
MSYGLRFLVNASLLKNQLEQQSAESDCCGDDREISYYKRAASLVANNHFNAKVH